LTVNLKFAELLNSVRASIKSVKRKQHKESSLPARVEEPTPESRLVKENIFQANSVELRIVEESTFVMFPVKDGIPHNRQGRKTNIVEGVEHIGVDNHAREETHPPVHPDGNDVKHILVEHIRNQVSVTSVGLAAMAEQQVFEEAELSNRVIGGTGSLGALKTSNTNSNVGSINHVNIVSTVANG
jgi:hypothetical protein